MTLIRAALAKARPAQVVSLPLLVAGLLIVSGCGSSSKGSSSTTESTPAAPPETNTQTSTESSSSESNTSSSSSEGGGSSVAVEANPEGQLKYNTSSLSAKAGKVTIDFTNSSPVGHNVTIESSAGKVVGATPTFQGGSKTLTTTLKPGTYKFFCSVPGHRQAGMEGTLTVK